MADKTAGQAPLYLALFTAGQPDRGVTGANSVSATAPTPNPSAICYLLFAERLPCGGRRIRAPHKAADRSTETPDAGASADPFSKRGSD
jgi:hypothetical protein